MGISKGQRYEINSFHLGFINIEPTDLLIEVVDADYDRNRLVLTPVLLPGSSPGKTFLSIQRWFQDEYPKYEIGRFVINNLAAFEKLIALKIASLHSNWS